MQYHERSERKDEREDSASLRFTYLGCSQWVVRRCHIESTCRGSYLVSNGVGRSFLRFWMLRVRTFPVLLLHLNDSVGKKLSFDEYVYEVVNSEWL
jgi:hypothetical protein